MITVSFDKPDDDGGDTIVKYEVTYDTSSTFNSPNKKSVEVDAQISKSYTITSLNAVYPRYFVSVRAGNAAGFGNPAFSVPASVPLGKRPPGKPHTVIARPGQGAGEIVVSWEPPVIPGHGTPCSSFPSTPAECPKEIGSAETSANGGSPLTMYRVQFSETPHFNGFDTGISDIDASQTTFTIKYLTKGRLYYIRVQAVNDQGMGDFCAFEDVYCNYYSKMAQAIATFG